jgi:hypothetical protein
MDAKSCCTKAVAGPVLRKPILEVPIIKLLDLYLLVRTLERTGKTW